MSINKKSFDYRMSKKVAELTQVVHMLFTRNHEKEVEIEAMKDAYENELDLVIAESNERINQLNVEIAELKKKAKGSDDSKVLLESQLENSIAQKENQWKERMEKLESKLKSEKTECQAVRDLLIQAQKDITSLQDEQSDVANETKRELHVKQKEIVTLKAHIREIEKTVQSSASKTTIALRDLQKTHEKTENELTETLKYLKSTEKVKEQLVAENKKLETEIAGLKREMKKMDRSGVHSAVSTTILNRPISTNEYTDEIMRLRAEITRYRMEISNREGNFNRMFSEKSPIVVDRRAGYLHGNEKPHFRYSNNQNKEQTSQTGAGYPFYVHVNETNALKSASHRLSVHQSLDTTGVEITLQDFPEYAKSVSKSISPNKILNSSPLPELTIHNKRRLTKPRPLDHKS